MTEEDSARDRKAASRAGAIDDESPAGTFGPADGTQSWSELAGQSLRCRACPLWEPAGPTVFGEGPVPADVMLVGEQPGDHEDRAGRPFVGPAGHVLDEALREVGLERSAVYVTNAVKHFKFVPRGKRRIHQTPTAGESAACRPWLRAELSLVRPQLLVLLGATAAKSILGPGFRLTKQHGVPVPSDAARHVTATIHPSAVLRAPPGERDEALAGLVADLEASLALLG
ncbi:MAG: UdgX family uracil-DNA binding protein [Actinobacteria bacterium]|nr:UdgX family uracil-DNA binding protein [Actinomycetota bacterium]